MAMVAMVIQIMVTATVMACPPNPPPMCNRLFRRTSSNILPVTGITAIIRKVIILMSRNVRAVGSRFHLLHNSRQTKGCRLGRAKRYPACNPKGWRRFSCLAQPMTYPRGHDHTHPTRLSWQPTNDQGLLIIQKPKSATPSAQPAICRRHRRTACGCFHAQTEGYRCLHNRKPYCAS